MIYHIYINNQIYWRTNILENLEQPDDKWRDNFNLSQLYF